MRNTVQENLRHRDIRAGRTFDGFSGIYGSESFRRSCSSDVFNICLFHDGHRCVGHLRLTRELSCLIKRTRKYSSSSDNKIFARPLHYSDSQSEGTQFSPSWSSSQNSRIRATFLIQTRDIDRVPQTRRSTSRRSSISFKLSSASRLNISPIRQKQQNPSEVDSRVAFSTAGRRETSNRSFPVSPRTPPIPPKFCRIAELIKTHQIRRHARHRPSFRTSRERKTRPGSHARCLKRHKIASRRDGEAHTRAWLLIINPGGSRDYAAL